MDWRDIPSTITIDGESHDVAWIDQAAGRSVNFGADVETITGLLVAQSRFFDGRLVTTLGYREDDVEIITFGHIDPDLFLGNPTVDFSPRSKAAVRDGQGNDPDLQVLNARAITCDGRMTSNEQGGIRILHAHMKSWSIPTCSILRMSPHSWV